MDERVREHRESKETFEMRTNEDGQRVSQLEAALDINSITFNQKALLNLKVESVPIPTLEKYLHLKFLAYQA